jgi:hypothetical protein
MFFFAFVECQMLIIRSFSCVCRIALHKRVTRLWPQARINIFDHTIVGKLLEHSERWKLWDQDAPPPRKDTPISLDDYDNDDAPRGGRNKWRPDVRRKVKLKVKKMAEQERQNS